MKPKSEDLVILIIATLATLTIIYSVYPNAVTNAIVIVVGIGIFLFILWIISKFKEIGE